MGHFLRAFFRVLAIGVPVALGTWTACCTTWSVEVGMRPALPLVMAYHKL
jgi:hypothetical protein